MTKDVGVRLVADDAEKYLKIMGDVHNVTVNVGKGAEQASGGLSRFNIAGVPLVATMGDIFSVGRRVLDIFVGMGREALGSVGAYEALTMSMSSLVSKEIRGADATLSMDEAMEQATGRATELLAWIQQLAIASPFDQQGVALAFKTGLTYGFTSDQAQTLTETLVNFATATGQTGAVIQQLAFPLGQIRNTGKVLTQDLRQLTNAGVDVTGVLRGMGKDWADVTAGTVESNAFLEQFIKTMNDDFAGAGERSAETINGLLNSLGDLREIGLRNLFGPAIQAALPLLAQMTSNLQAMLPVLELVGEKVGGFVTHLIENRAEIARSLTPLGAAAATYLILGNASTIAAASTGLLTGAIGVLTGVVGALLSPVGLLAAAAFGIVKVLMAVRDSAGGAAEGTRLVSSEFRRASGDIQLEAEESGEKARGWGANLVIQFAEGMAAAIGAVIDVLTQIGQAIAGWLAPGSPPKLLPEIDQWGEAAMGEFLQGFGKADLDVFSQISSKIGSVLKSAAPGDDTGLIPRVLGARTELTNAIRELQETGNVGEATFQRLFNAIGPTESALEGYIRATFEVKKAQNNLNEITERYRDLLRPMNEELDAIGARRQEIVDEQRKSELKAILSQENLDPLAEELALMELREIELKKQVRATEKQGASEAGRAQKALTASKEEAAAQAGILGIQTENNNLLARQAGLLERLSNELSKLSGAVSGSGGLGAGLQSGLGGVPSLTESVGTAFDDMKEKALGFVEDVKAPFAKLKDRWIELKKTWAGVALNFIARLDPMTTALREAWGPGGHWESVTKNIQTIMVNQWGEGGTWDGIAANAKETLRLLGVKWEESWGEGGTWDSIFANIKTAISLVRDKIDEQLEAINSKFATAKEFISGLLERLEALWQFLQTHLMELELNLPSLPSPYQENSPQTRLQTSLEMLDKFLQRTTFAPQFDFPQPSPIPVLQTTPPVASVNNTRSASINMGGQVINHPMDLRTLETTILNVVKKALE